MNPLPRVAGSDDDTLLPEEIIRNLSILTSDYDQAGLAPAYGTVGDYSMLDGEMFVDENGQQVAPVRKQSCSQVLIRKSNGEYWPFVDGVKSQSNNTATIASYRGENVHVTLRQMSDKPSTQEYNTVCGFRGETSSQRMIGPLAICVIVEEGQTPPDDIEVRIWQETVISGVTKPRTLNSVVKLRASELARDGDIKCLTVPFPATFMRPPFVEIRDTDNEKRTQVEAYSKAPKRLFQKLSWLLIAAVTNPTAYAMSKSWNIWQGVTIASGIVYNTTTGLFTRAARNNYDFATSSMINLIGTVLAVFPFGLSDAVFNMTPREWFALSTNLDGYGDAEGDILRNFVPQTDATESGYVLQANNGTKVSREDLIDMKGAAQAKFVNNLSRTAMDAFAPTLDRTSRVRFTIPQLADTLSQIATKGGAGMVWQFDDSKMPKRERVLRRFLNTPDSRWAKLKINDICKHSKDAEMKKVCVILPSRFTLPNTHWHPRLNRRYNFPVAQR